MGRYQTRRRLLRPGPGALTRGCLSDCRRCQGLMKYLLWPLSSLRIDLDVTAAQNQYLRPPSHTVLPTTGVTRGRIETTDNRRCCGNIDHPSVAPWQADPSRRRVMLAYIPRSRDDRLSIALLIGRMPAQGRYRAARTGGAGRGLVPRGLHP